MIALEDIEDALKADMKANITGLKTVETHEKEFDKALLSALLPRAPFTLIRYGGTNPHDDERHADNSSGMNGREFHLTIGAESLRSKKEGQRGVYKFLDMIKERYDGMQLTVGSESISLHYDGDAFWFSSDSLVVYKMFLKWDEN